MFWGLVLEPGKRYSTTVEKSFHVSKAVLDCSSVRNDNEILSVMLETEGSEALLCNLCKQKGLLQESLDLNFMSGDRLTFECRGHGRIHLSGYLLPDEDDDMSGMLGDEEESEEEDSAMLASPEKPKKEKRKQDSQPEVATKKKKVVTEDDDADSDSGEDEESDLSEDMDEDDGLEDEEEEGSSEKDDDESDEDDEEEDEDGHNNSKFTPKEKSQLQKQDKNKTPNKQGQTPKKTPVTNGIAPKEQKSNKKSLGVDKSPNQNTTPKQKTVLESGVVIKDLRIGNGPVAKPGKMCSMYYVGKLKDSGKVFDKSAKGDAFKFRLGRGEVIKGWDIGVQGMKVGGKRTIHCPPEVAYGSKGAPPKIGPNSTLMFEVELKSVN